MYQSHYFIKAPQGIVNNVSGKLSNDKVNVDNAITIGNTQVQEFLSKLPDGFYDKLSKKVQSMAVVRKSVTIGEIDIIDTALIYSRVIALQLSDSSIKMDNVLRYELAPIPTSMFHESGDMRIAKGKSVLKNKLCIEVSARLKD